MREQPGRRVRYSSNRTGIRLIAKWENWLWCLAVIAIATAFAAAKLAGLSWRESAGLGILMNTRELVELIVINIGLEFKSSPQPSSP